MTPDTVAALFLQYKYPMLVALSFFEGPYIMMMSGLFIKLGIFTLIPTYIALSIGDLLGDAAWYYVGYFFGEKIATSWVGRMFDITTYNIESVKHILLGNKKKILMGSKLTAGFGLSLAVLVAAGIAEIPIGEFLLLNFVGQFWWTAVMLSVGYFFGNLYLVIDNVAGKIFIVIIASLILFLLLRLSRHTGRKLRKKIAGE